MLVDYIIRWYETQELENKSWEVDNIYLIKLWTPIHEKSAYNK